MQKREGSIKGIKVAGSFNLTHLLFVDDVIFFGIGTLQEVKNIRKFWTCVANLLGWKYTFTSPLLFSMGWKKIWKDR
jgi:hypothetical protein